jgi:hypothetical protein
MRLSSERPDRDDHETRSFPRAFAASSSTRSRSPQRVHHNRISAIRLKLGNLRSRSATETSATCPQTSHSAVTVSWCVRCSTRAAYIGTMAHSDQRSVALQWLEQGGIRVLHAPYARAHRVRLHGGRWIRLEHHHEVRRFGRLLTKASGVVFRLKDHRHPIADRCADFIAASEQQRADPSGSPRCVRFSPTVNQIYVFLLFPSELDHGLVQFRP